MNSEEKKAKTTKLIEDNKFFEKWGVGKVSLKQLSQNKSPQEILEQYQKAYPKITEFVKTYQYSTKSDEQTT